MPPGVLASGPKPCGGNYAGVSIMPPRVLPRGQNPTGAIIHSTATTSIQPLRKIVITSQ